MTSDSWELPVHRDADPTDIMIGTVVFEGRDIVGFVSHYDFRDSDFSGDVSWGERLSASVGFSRGMFVSTAIRELQNAILDTDVRIFDANQINEIRYTNMTSAAASVGTELLQDALISAFVSNFGGPILNNIVAQFTSDVIPQIVFTAIGERIVEEVIGGALDTSPDDVANANYTVRYVSPENTDDEEDIEDFVIPAETPEDEDPIGEIIVSPRGGTAFSGSEGNDIIVSSRGGDTIDMSAGGDNEIVINAMARGVTDNTVIGGQGNDELTLAAGEEHSSSSISQWSFKARMPGDGGELLGVRASLSEIETLAQQEGPRLIVYGGGDGGVTTATRKGTTEISGIDTLNYTGGSGSDLFIPFGDTPTILGGGGNNTLYADWSGQDVGVTWDVSDSLESEVTLANGWTVQDIDRVLLRLSDHGNHIILHDGDNVIYGGAADDTFTGGAGDDMLIGGDGQDTAVYSGARGDYDIAPDDAGNLIVTDQRGGGDGTDTLRQIQTLQFSDGAVDTGDFITDVTLAGQVTDTGGTALPGASLAVLDAGGATLDTLTSDAAGRFSTTLPDGEAARLDASRDHDPDAGDPAISALDALDVLRLAVGLAPSFGDAQAQNYIAADINADNAVTALDALEVLRAAVGLDSAHAPRWAFFDAATDWDGVGASRGAVNAPDTGIELSGIAPGAELDMTGILLGNMESV